MSDEFDDPRVNPQWAWLDSDSDDSYNTTDRNGWMRMILNSGSEDHWKDVSGGAPYLLTEMLQVPEFSIITNVDYATANNDQLVIRSLAGIALYDEGNDLDADPFELRFGCEVVDTGLRAMLQIPGQTLASADLPGGTTVSQLKLTRKAADSLWIAYYRTDDLSEWIEVGRVFDTTLPGGATVSPRVGLFGLTWGDTSPASFDFDHYTVEMPCGAWGYLPGDINKDCHVDFVDFAELASNWLKCSMPQQQGCEGY